MLRMNLRIMRVTFSHKKSQRIQSWRPMSNHLKSSIGCSDRLYENDCILSPSGESGSMSFPRYRIENKGFLLRNPKENDVP